MPAISMFYVMGLLFVFIFLTMKGIGFRIFMQSTREVTHPFPSFSIFYFRWHRPFGRNTPCENENGAGMD
jgi:uncharacterized membrane protein YjgN (DUF898 family)